MITVPSIYFSGEKQHKVQIPDCTQHHCYRMMNRTLPHCMDVLIGLALYWQRSGIVLEHHFMRVITINIETNLNMSGNPGKDCTHTAVCTWQPQRKCRLPTKSHLQNIHPKTNPGNTATELFQWSYILQCFLGNNCKCHLSI